MRNHRNGFLRSAMAGLVAAWAPFAFAGTITGVARYEGEIPKLPGLKMEADPVCTMKHGEKTPTVELLVLGADRTMANVFVHVTKGIPEKTHPVPAEPVVLTQEGCIYTPHVFGIRAGQTLKILNPDGTTHNVNAQCVVNKPVNLGMPPQMAETSAVFNEPEPIFPIRCDVHPWMKAYCAVMAHPYFDVTEKDGGFTLADLPAGDYEVQAWHEKLGEQTVTVTLGADETKELTFVFARPSSG